jgi:hypothetical protein
MHAFMCRGLDGKVEYNIIIDLCKSSRENPNASKIILETIHDANRTVPLYQMMLKYDEQNFPVPSNIIFLILMPNLNFCIYVPGYYIIFHE